MKASLFYLVTAALTVSATPVGDVSSGQLVPKNAAGCNYFADPDHCVPTVCMCANGWIYLINEDYPGGDGCNPPWGFIATDETGYPGFC